MEMEEAEAEALARRIEELYRELHPEDHLRTLRGVGEHTAPVFLAAVGDPHRFSYQAAFWNWTRVVRRSGRSSDSEGKRLGMTQAGLAHL